MIRAEHRFHLPTPVHGAFSLLSDVTRESKWRPTCVESVMIRDEGGVGNRYRVAHDMVGRHMKFIVEMRRDQANERSDFEAVEGPFKFTVVYEFAHAVDDSTEVSWCFTADAAKYFGIIPESLIEKVVTDQMEIDMAGLAESLRRTERPQWAP
jgi:ribosome-associated toxin RatA of RatAB toxin-antitoxin module